MSSYLFDTNGLAEHHIDLFENTCTALCDKFRIERPGGIDFHLEQFEVFRHYTDINVRDAFAIKKLCGDSYMLFLETNSAVPARGNGLPVHLKDYQNWALTYLKHDFGRVLIRHETLVDKMLEVIHPIELDFVDDKPFSRRFYVLTDDRHKAEAAMTNQFRDALMALKSNDFVIEIFEHTLIIGNRQPISAHDACQMAEFVSAVAALK